MSTIPLVYHYSGNDLPNYAYGALRQASKEWPGRVVLIHDRPLRTQIRGVEIVHPDGWYDRSHFDGWVDSTEMELGFRGGFWFHAVERFFMLEQWAKTFGISRFLHVELDVTVYCCRTLMDVLQELPPKIYFPRGSQSHAGANWLYCGSNSAMSQLTNFFSSSAGDEFEMALLARFLDEFPTIAESAPSHFTIEMAQNGESQQDEEKIALWGGVVDVHPIGTWLMGRDPRNVKTIMNYNHRFYEGLGNDNLSQLRYGFDMEKRCLTVSSGRLGPYPVFAIHVHSKKVRRAYRPLYLGALSIFANFPFAIPIGLGNPALGFRRILRLLMDPLYRIIRRILRSMSFGS